MAVLSNERVVLRPSDGGDPVAIVYTCGYWERMMRHGGCEEMPDPMGMGGHSHDWPRAKSESRSAGVRLCPSPLVIRTT